MSFCIRPRILLPTRVELSIIRSSPRASQSLNAYRLQPLTLNSYKPTDRRLITSSSAKMSDKFSNTDTGSKQADPYTAKNKDDPQLKEKIEDLVAFMERCKFGMMTTRIASTGQLVSRCMALAAKVRPALPSRLFHLWTQVSFIIRTLLTNTLQNPGRWRYRPPLPHQHRIWQNRRPPVRPHNQHRLPQSQR